MKNKNRFIFAMTMVFFSYTAFAQDEIFADSDKQDSIRNILDACLIKMSWSFPFSDRLRGYVQLFNGYRDSLINYIQNTSRMGVRILLSNWL